METKHLNINSLELKFAGDMTFAGYASIFGGVDAYGDTIDPEAYKNTLSNRSRPIRMKWNHYGPVIGKYTHISTDTKGLFVEGELTPGHSVAQDVYASMKHGAIDGMSIGYIAKKSEPIGEGRRLLKEIELFEISIVEEPADLGAKINDIKSAIDECQSLKEIEALLREAGGFSRTDAVSLVGRIKKLSLGDQDDEKLKRELAQMFNLPL